MSGYDKDSLSCLKAINVFCYNFLIYRFMKYLRLFEGKELKYNIGDRVVMLENNIGLFHGTILDFKVGKIYTIIDIDYMIGEKYPYNLGDEDNDLIDAWVMEKQIRLAEPLDLDQKKYNL